MSKSINYLTCTDWIFHAIDDSSRSSTGCGILSQVILCLDRLLEVDRVRLQASAFFRMFPVVHGQCARAWNFAPYWAYREGVPKDIPFVSETRATDDEAVAFLHACVNEPFTREHEYLRFMYVTVGTHAYVSLIFDHRLLDANGAQSLLLLFHQFYSGQFQLPCSSFPERPSAALSLREKFRAGRRVYRRLFDIVRHGPVRYLPVQEDLKGRAFRFQTYAFDLSESEYITVRAYATAGYLMMSPYLLAASLTAFHDVFGKSLLPGESFVVPVTMDVRSRLFRAEEIFFNRHLVSFLRLPSIISKPFRAFVGQVSRAMHEEMSSGFAQDLERAFLFVPRWIMRSVITSRKRVPRCSFMFSYVNKGYGAFEFCGAKVQSVVHTPRLEASLGVGVFFTQFNGHISLTFVFLDGMFPGREAALFISRVREVLLEEADR